MQKLPQAEFKTFLLPVEFPHSEEKVFLLFSKSQIVEVLREVTINPVPFCADYIEGGTSYFYRLLPVVTPEKVLGLDGDHVKGGKGHFIVVRSSAVDPQSGENLQVVFSASGKLEQPTADTEQRISGMRSIAQPEFLDDSAMTRAVFKKDEAYYIVVDLNRLVLGDT